MNKQEKANKEAFETVARVAMHGGRMGIVNDGTYELAPLKPTVGTWYFVLDCPSCQKRTPIFEDAAKGKFLTTYSGNGKVKTTCNHCKAAVTLPPTAIHRIRWV